MQGEPLPACSEPESQQAPWGTLDVGLGWEELRGKLSEDPKLQDQRAQ